MTRVSAWALAIGVAFALALTLTAISGVARADEVSFRRDVMAVLSKAGCNAGTCHGNLTGKGGFKLSLRGQDPAADYRTLTRGQFGRRTDRLRPADSLILRKPTTTIPHEGGKRFDADSLEYRILHRWLAAGMPDDVRDGPRLARLDVSPHNQVLIEPVTSVQLHVTAVFADGSTRDVTRLTVFEPSNQLVTVSRDGLVQRHQAGQTTVLARYLDRQAPVRLAFVPARPNFTPQSPPAGNYIDEHIFARLRELRMNPSPVCDDRTFVRRAYLDLLGMWPSADQARAFVDDKRTDKRARLIGALLDRPQFADFWALKWSDVLRNEEKVIDTKGVDAFYGWLRDSIASNKPMDRFVRELVTARGSTYKNPPANYYRALRQPNIRAEATAQLFLGTRVLCAKCHNHPFDRWTQNDYYRFAAFFARIDYKIVENKRRDKYDKHQFIGEQIVLHKDSGEVKHPYTGAVMQPAPLGGSAVEIKGDKDRLDVLAKWLTSPDNPRFARAMVNRIWYHLMGRGIVDPIDDFRNTNPPSHPQLLDALARDFVKHGFDLRHMIRVICASRTYQLSSRPNQTNARDDRNFSHAVIRRLTAEQMIDSMAAAMDAPVRFNGYPDGLRAAQVSGVSRVYHDKHPSPADRFLKLFGRPKRLSSCECERNNETTLGQAFELTSGELINDLLTHKDNRIGKLLADKRSDEQIINALYDSALSRRPTNPERDAALRLVKQAKDRREGLEDVAWGLLNAKEFVLRR